LLVRTALLLASVTLAACAAAGTVATSFDATPRRSVPSLDTRAHAYHEFVVAQMAAQAGRFTEAIPALREALKRDPNLAYLWTTLAQWLVRTDAADEALAAARRAVELAPDEVASHTTLAELDPDHDGAWTALGYVYETRRKPDEAVEIYRRAAKANPDNPAFVERLGDLLIRLGRFQEAQAEIEALAEVAPRDARVWMKLG